MLKLLNSDILVSILTRSNLDGRVGLVSLESNQLVCGQLHIDIGEIGFRERGHDEDTQMKHDI